MGGSGTPGTDEADDGRFWIEPCLVMTTTNWGDRATGDDMIPSHLPWLQTNGLEWTIVASDLAFQAIPRDEILARDFYLGAAGFIMCCTCV